MTDPRAPDGAGQPPGGEPAGRPPARVPEPGSGLPASRAIDRAALDRILARAAELQLDAGMPADGALTEWQFLELGKEVGLSTEYLRQALAEERTRIAPPAEVGFMANVFGSATATAIRVVPGTPERVLASLDKWMQREECLQVKRRFTDRIVWEARRDIVGSIKRGFNIGGRGYFLSRADDVAATVLPAEEGRSTVRLDALLRDARGARVAGSVGALASGAAVSGIAVILGVMMPVALIPAALSVGGAWATGRGHRRTVTRAQLALEQVLDRLEYGEMDQRQPGLLGILSPPRRSP
ncbi:MAG TPA: hypothetical protein VMM18_16705 [Gemmatimonadaceae bacterium]|nr:hypothetical protein [Gemmatimonadaceae bacterium]